MYYIFVILLIIFAITLLFININTFQMRDHKFWYISLIIINLSLMFFIIIFYYKKVSEPGARGFRGYNGEIGQEGENYESCS
jgi:glucan phosphoethanolaminetransferase (alkaline phosphatase superfamily)